MRKKLNELRRLLAVAVIIQAGLLVFFRTGLNRSITTAAKKTCAPPTVKMQNGLPLLIMPLNAWYAIPTVTAVKTADINLVVQTEPPPCGRLCANVL